jgi:NPCBM/NEW2 domain
MHLGTILALVLAGQVPAIYLDDLQEVDYKVSHGQLGKHGSYGFGVAEVQFDGKTYNHAISAHPSANGMSWVVYEVNRSNLVFKGKVALGDAGEKPESPVSFAILGDGKPLWRSRPLDRKGVAQDFDVPLLGVVRLEIRTICQGGNSWAVGVWLDPRLELPPKQLTRRRQ